MKAEDLKKGQTLLTNVKKVAGGKFQIEIAELIENPNQTVNVAALLNAGDSRFDVNAPKARRAWQSATNEGLLLLGVNIDKLNFIANSEGKEIAEVNILNPSIAGMRLHVQLEDSFVASYETQEPKQTNGKNGVKFFMKDGKHIYQNTKIVAGEPVHSLIVSDVRVSEVVKQELVKEAIQLNA